MDGIFITIDNKDQTTEIQASFRKQIFGIFFWERKIDISLF